MARPLLMLKNPIDLMHSSILCAEVALTLGSSLLHVKCQVSHVQQLNFLASLDTTLNNLASSLELGSLQKLPTLYEVTQHLIVYYRT